MKNLSFYVLIKNVNTGELEHYDIMPTIYKEIYDGNKLSKNFKVYTKGKLVPVTNKELLKEFIEKELKYHYWSKCEYEFIVIDWPYKGEFIKDNNPIKLDVYSQIVNNIPILVNLLWNEIKPFIEKETY